MRQTEAHIFQNGTSKALPANSVKSARLLAMEVPWIIGFMLCLFLFVVIFGEFLFDYSIFCCIYV